MVIKVIIEEAAYRSKEPIDQVLENPVSFQDDTFYIMEEED